jgi:hypothetical protein
MSTELVNIKSIINHVNYNLIVLGDFNDNSYIKKENYFRNLKPFKYSDMIFKDIKVSCCITNKPPNTCCVGDTNLRSLINKDQFYGDYILINDSLISIMQLVPPNFNQDGNTFPTSDHLPIIHLIKLKSNATITLHTPIIPSTSSIEINKFDKKYVKYKLKYLKLKKNYNLYSL